VFELFEQGSTTLSANDKMMEARY